MSNFSNRVVFLLFLSIMITISACAKMPPKCSDEKTLHLVREIVFGKEYTNNELKDNVMIEYHLATAEDKNIKKISCEAKLNILNKYRLPITYASQLDDKNQQVVSVSGISSENSYAVTNAFSNAVKESRERNEKEKAQKKQRVCFKSQRS